MKASRTIAAALALLVMAGVLVVSVQAAPGPQKGKQEPKPQAKAPIPKEVAAVIQEGLTTRQGRQDIPFSVFKTLILPAQQAMFPVFFFKAKNGDLGYAAPAAGLGQMETTVNIFYEFYQPDPSGTLKARTGGRNQVLLTADADGYSPDKEDWYTFGTAMPAGAYTLAFALTTPDMKKISVAYADVTLPGPEAYEAALWPTDPVQVLAMEQVEPDPRPTIHRGYLVWGAAKLVINPNPEVKEGENLEVLFFVIGASPKDPTAPRPTLDLECSFEVVGEDGKTVIRWAPSSYELYLINQPLPLFQTIQKQDEKGTVLSTEKKPLPAGKYTLVATITDKVSGKKGEAKMPFAVI